MSLASTPNGLPPTETQMPLATRIDDLVARGVFERVDAQNADAFAGAPGDSVLLLTADPRTNPESWDALIVLPEMLRGLGAALRAGVVGPGESARLALRFGVRTYPSLVFQRGGEFVGAIEGLQDWQGYVRRTAELLTAPTTRVPTLGIPVVAAGRDSACH